MESSKKLEKLYNYIQSVIKIVGANVFDPNYKVNSRTIFTASLPISLSISYIFMLFQDHPLPFILEGLIMNFLIIQGTTKLFVAAFNAKEMYATLQRIYCMYNNDARMHENQNCLNRCIDYCLLLYKLLAVTYFSVLVIYSTLPVVVYRYSGTLVTLFPVHLPYLNPDSILGFTINIIHQLTFLVLGVLGVLSMDSGLLMILLNYIPFVNLLRIRLNELNDELKKPVYDIKLVRKLIHDGIVQHQTLISYIKDINSSFSIVMAVQIFATAGAMVISIFLFVWQKWIVGPCLVIASLFQLAEFCFAGTLIQIQNEKVADLIYNISWYALPATEQKLIRLMVMQSLRSTELVAAYIVYVNVETFTQVLKLIYSFTMMIIELLKE